MPIRVLVVDDSALMRKYIRQILEDDGHFEVRTAREGRDALEQVRNYPPDVVTLDIHMPVMDGLTCLSHIMVEHPCPVVMLSSLTERGALATFEALELGAVDYISKPGGTVSLNVKDIGPEICAKVRAAARASPRRAIDRISTPSPRPRIRPQRAPTLTSSRCAARDARASLGSPNGVVLIGVSTGGPSTLEEILPRLPPNLGLPVLVAQHMPAGFTRVFSERLDRVCAMPVREVTKQVPLSPGQILIARGDADVVIARRGAGHAAVSVPKSPCHVWNPSVERMVLSAIAQLPPSRVIGVMLTGMGHDGADAMTELRRLGGRTIAEAESTAVIFGMPRELISRGGADIVLPCHRIAGQITTFADKVTGGRT